MEGILATQRDYEEAIGQIIKNVGAVRKVAAHLGELIDVTIPLGALDVTLYRDDVIGRGKRPVPQRTNMPFSVAGKSSVQVQVEWRGAWSRTNPIASRPTRSR